MLIKEDTRAMWRWTLAEQFAQDLRYALRQLRKSPGFTLTAVLSLALGIGANTAIFTVVNAVLLRPLPFPEPDRLVQIWETKPSQGYFRNVVNGLNFLDWGERTRSFDGIAAVDGGTTNLTGLGDPLALPGMGVSPNFFSILGVSPGLGHSFLPEDGLPAHEQVAILSFGLTRVLRTLLYETAPNDPATLAFVAVTILFVVLLATLIPAQRAAQVSPNTALRYE
jgi:hypothetical protein